MLKSKVLVKIVEFLGDNGTVSAELHMKLGEF